jgi:hypothetical protein
LTATAATSDASQFQLNVRDEISRSVGYCQGRVSYKLTSHPRSGSASPTVVQYFVEQGVVRVGGPRDVPGQRLQVDAAP